MVSSLADAPTGKCNEALEWVESRDNARHAQKAFSCSAGTNSSSSSSSSRSGNGDGGNGEGGSNNKRQCPVMVLVTASVRPDALLRSFDRSSTSDKKSVINDGSGGGPSDSSSSSDSSKGDQGVRFLRACSSVPLFHAAGTVVRRNEACEAIDLSFKLLLFMNSAPESLLFATAPPMSVQCIEEIVWTK